MWGRKKEKEEQPIAEVVELYKTATTRQTFYGIKIGEKFGCDRDGNPICTSNLRYVRDVVRRINKER